MSQIELKARLDNLSLPDPDLMKMSDVIDVYEALRPIMPPARNCQTTYVSRLIDLVDQVDAFIFDGYGVINVGDGPIAGINEVFAVAEQKGVPIIVLTNGASYGAARAWQKYVSWGLPIAESHVVSSRDALEAALAPRAGQLAYGSLSAASQPLGYEGELRYGDAGFFEQAEEFVFLGTIGWTMADQQLLEAALQRKGRAIHIANPDVASPQTEGISAEPGYWAVRAIQQTGAAVSWYGKPHEAAFAMAFARLEVVTGRRFEKGRVAMVGDSLHTDIIGAAAFGLRTVLLTDYGPFREGGARAVADACGIHADWMVEKL